MNIVVQAILTLIEQLLPAITSASNASLISSVLDALVKMMPFIVDEISALATPVKNIIAALSANPATTTDQLAQLQVLDKQVDDAFEDAAKDTDDGN